MLIQSVMLVSLGFLCASLLALILAPFLWKRAVRLTTERIKASMPITQSEMQADKDQLRAEFAIKIRQFEVDLEHTNIKAARQLIELSRRETDISKLKVELQKISTELEEQHNANNVMRQTITTRIPQLEAKLQKAKEMLGERFQEISRLRTTISQQEGELGEVRSVEQQRLAEIQRLRSTLEAQERIKVAQDEYEKLKTKNETLIAEVHQLKNQLIKAQNNAQTDAKGLKQQMHALSDRIVEISKTQQGSPKESLSTPYQKPAPQQFGTYAPGALGAGVQQSFQKQDVSQKPVTSSEKTLSEKDKAAHPPHLKPVQDAKPQEPATTSTANTSAANSSSTETGTGVRDDKPKITSSQSSSFQASPYSSGSQASLSQPHVQQVQPPVKPQAHVITKTRIKDETNDDMHPALQAQSND